MNTKRTKSNSIIFSSLGVLLLCGLFPIPSFAQVANTMPALTIATDLPRYNEGDTVTFSGFIKSPDVNNVIDVTVRVLGPVVDGSNGLIVSMDQVEPNPDGSFEGSFIPYGDRWIKRGDYKILANYGPQKAETMFFYNGGTGELAPDVQPPPPQCAPGQIIVNGQCANPEDEVYFSNLRLTNSFGEPISNHVNSNQQFSFVVDVLNGHEKEQPFTYLIQVEHQKPKWITASVSPGQLFSPAISWSVPDDSVAYHVTAYLYDNMNNRQSLASPLSMTVNGDDGTGAVPIPLIITTEVAHEGSPLSISITSTLENKIYFMNYNIHVIQNEEVILDKDIYYEEKFCTPNCESQRYETIPLATTSPINIQVTFQGYSLPGESFLFGPIGEVITLQVVPKLPIPLDDFSYYETVSLPAGSAASYCEEIDECYAPSTIGIASGGEVVWTNDDIAAHTVTSGNPKDGPDGNFDSSIVMSGATFSHTFEEEGEFPYFCLLHPWMQGTVIVVQGTEGIPEESTEEETEEETVEESEDIELFAEVDKSEYDLGEVVTLFTHISGISSPQNVAITVTDAFDTVVVSRTLSTDSDGDASIDFKISENFKTGTYYIDATSLIDDSTYLDDSTFKVTSQFNQIQLVSAQGADQEGNPMEFSRGTTGYVKVQLNTQKPIATLVTVNVFDSDLTPLGVGSLKTTLSNGQTELILSFMIPEDAVVGTADIYVNALSDWVSAGGIPQTGEFVGQVRIN